MNRKKYISGLFSNTLEKCANWFLYIFIDPSAPVSKAILAKRARQIATLHLLDKINGVYNFTELVNFVERGIKTKYGLSPVQVLSVVNQAAKKKIAGIGETFTGSHFDGEIWVDDTTGDPLPEAEQYNATKVANSTIDGSFWNDISSLIDYIIEMFQKLGIGKKQQDINQGTATVTDWYNQTNKADMSSSITYVAVALIGYSLWKSTQDRQKQ